jgi:hypothetical protein
MSDVTPERNARLWKRTISADSGAGPPLLNLRNVTMADIPALGALFSDAFIRTIDDANQTKAQYVAKATAIVGGRYGEWIPTASWAIEEGGALRSACLVCDTGPHPSDSSGVTGSCLNSVDRDLPNG